MPDSDEAGANNGGNPSPVTDEHDGAVHVDVSAGDSAFVDESSGETGELSPGDEGWQLESDGVRVRIPPDASPAEAAAIAAVLGATIQDERADAADSRDTKADWTGERFRFAGRVEGLTGITRRVPIGAPRDEWTAIGRLDRM